MLGHVDSIYAGFVMAVFIAVIRFLYFVFWSTRGGSPFSAVGMYFLTMLVTLIVLGGSYWITGRLKQNWKSLLALLVVTASWAVLGAGHYKVMDLPG